MQRDKSHGLLLLLLLLGISFVVAIINSSGKILSRKQRYVAFPEGSSVSGALCLTIGVIGNPHTDYLSYALNWGVAYDLPNETWARQHANGFKGDPQSAKPVVLRRTRREVYEKIEATMNDMGFNGRACIARSLCESSKYLRHHQHGRGNMVEEIVRTIFSLPQQHVRPHESDAVHHYDRIYRRAPREVRDCSSEYPECHFSLLDLALGKYSRVNTGQHRARDGPAVMGAPFM